MGGYHPAAQGTPVKVTTREQAYTGPGVASTVPGGLGMPVSGISQGMAQPMTSDGGYNMRAKYVLPISVYCRMSKLMWNRS